MKYFYVFLFFADMLLFAALCFLWLQEKDRGSGLFTLVLVALGALVSLGLLVLFLHLYIREPPSSGRSDYDS